jgi:hypothetical protein
VKDPIHIVEAAYFYDATSETEWLARIAEAVLQNMPGAHGAAAYAYEIQQRGPIPWIAPGAIAEVNTPAGLIAAFLNRGPQELAVQRATAALHRVTGLQSALRFMQLVPEYASEMQFYREGLRSNGFDDIVVITAADPTPHGCVVGVLTQSAVHVYPSARLQWQRLAAHIAAGFRIRRKIAESGAVDATHGADRSF